MLCPKCVQSLRIASGKFTSEEGSTDVYSEQTLVCVNPDCDNYSGTDLSNPKIIVQTLRNKVN